MISSLLLCFDPMLVLLICVEVFGMLIEEFRRIFCAGIRSRGEGRSDLGVLERSFSKFSKKESRGERPAAFPPKPAKGRRRWGGLAFKAGGL